MRVAWTQLTDMTAEFKRAPLKLENDSKACFFFFSRCLSSNLTPGNLPADRRAFENWQVATSHSFPEGGEEGEGCFIPL